MARRVARSAPGGARRPLSYRIMATNPNQPYFLRSRPRVTFGSLNLPPPHRSPAMASVAQAETRRRFLAHFSSIGLGSSLVPGVLWGQMQQSGAEDVTPEMVHDALALSGLDFPAE